MEFHNKNAVIVGLGKSGMAALSLLKRQGTNVCLYDSNTEKDISHLMETKFPHEKVYLGSFPEEEFADLDFAVFSPGVPLSVPLYTFFKKNKVPVIGEIELAYMLEKGRVVGITGTNGKTTTTTLVGEIVRAYYKDVFVVGNIGVPYTEMVEKSSKNSVTVAEISSFQLATTRHFAPKISAILNITPDHLDWHGNMKDYQEAKLAVAKNQGKDDVCILNYEDEFLRDNAKTLHTRVRFFSSKTKLQSGIYLSPSGDIIVADTDEIFCNVSDCRLLGNHNYENYMAAILIGIELNIPMDIIRDAVTAFKGVEHRVEFVREWRGVNYYNDSKGTNPDAAIKGIQSMNRKTVLIGGGFDKKADFTDWIRSFEGKVTTLILLGETKEKIAKTAIKCGFHSIVMTESLKDAVEKASTFAKDGEAVLLSPACASWDMFASYEHRGDEFKQYVNDLE